MNNRTKLCLSAVIILGALFTIGVTAPRAAVPIRIQMQGSVSRTTPPVGPLQGGHLTRFSVLQGGDPVTGTGGALVYQEDITLTYTNGLFSHILGTGTPAPNCGAEAPCLLTEADFNTGTLYASIAIIGETMLPWTTLTSVPFAIRVATIDGAIGGVVSGDLMLSAGNINLGPSTVTSGNILKDGVPFIHNYGANNTFIGRPAGNRSMTGSFNTASGAFTLIDNTTGTNNTATGYTVLTSNTTGDYNTASGVSALNHNTEGNYNTASGDGALNHNSTADYNTANGASALFSNTTGSSNTASGWQALYSNTTGDSNTASGAHALFSNTTGQFNTASGFGALFSNTTGQFNTASGYRALASNTYGYLNTACGGTALWSNTTGISNTGCGASALFSNTSGDRNTATGAGALQSNTTGFQNTASGTQALQDNTTGYNNTACGRSALYDNTTGIQNTASGAQALEANTVGNYNTAGGSFALFRNTTGEYNTASGKDALYMNTTGSNNTASGYDALRTITTGIGNTAIGSGADVSASALTNATAIGYNAKVDASNKIRFGNEAVTVIEAQVGLTVVSDSNAKENIRPVDGDEVLRKIKELRLASWNLKGHDPEQFRHYGPMAQEFFAAFGHDGVGSIGTPTTINSSDMAGILMIAVQALEKRTAENVELRARIERLEELMQATRTGEYGATE